MSNTKDDAKLTDMVQRQVARTGSTTAEGLMKDPPSIPGKFRKIIPKEYAQARKKLEEDEK